MHPHKEIGMDEPHYHADNRFIRYVENTTIINNKHSKHIFLSEDCDESEVKGNLQYLPLPVINEDIKFIISLKEIKKFKGKCVKNNKCPHQGYDLCQVKSLNGKIKCPLHGLTFDEKTKIIE